MGLREMPEIGCCGFMKARDKFMNIYKSIVSRISIDKGWSGDQKYCVTTADDHKYLLRILLRIVIC